MRTILYLLKKLSMSFKAFPGQMASLVESPMYGINLSTVFVLNVSAQALKWLTQGSLCVCGTWCCLLALSLHLLPTAAGSASLPSPGRCQKRQIKRKMPKALTQAVLSLAPLLRPSPRHTPNPLPCSHACQVSVMKCCPFVVSAVGPSAAGSTPGKTSGGCEDGNTDCQRWFDDLVIKGAGPESFLPHRRFCSQRTLLSVGFPHPITTTKKWAQGLNRRSPKNM